MTQACTFNDKIRLCFWFRLSEFLQFMLEHLKFVSSLITADWSETIYFRVDFFFLIFVNDFF